MTDTGFQPAQPADYAPRTATNYLPSTLHTDAIEYLPRGAADRLRALRQRSADLHALTVGFEELQEANVEKQKAAERVRHLTDHPANFGQNLPLEHRSVQDAMAQLARASDELARLQARADERTAAWRAASAALGTAENWIKHGLPGGVVLEDYAGPVPALAKGERDVLAAIENRRRRARELRSDLHRIESAPYPSSYAKRKMRQEVEHLAQRGSVSVSGLIEHDGAIIWPMQHARSRVLGSTDAAVVFAEVPDFAVLVWLDPDSWVKKLAAEIDAELDDAAALSIEDRQKASSTVQADLIATEREEAFHVFSAQAQGLPCEHRHDCSPMALLNLSLVVRAAVALPATSPGLVVDVARPR